MKKLVQKLYSLSVKVVNDWKALDIKKRCMIIIEMLIAVIVILLVI